MRRIKSVRSYFQLFAVILALMSIPRDPSLRIKGMTVATLAPAWEQLQSIKKALQHVTDIRITEDDGSVFYAKDEIHRLNLENQLLKNEVHHLSDILKNETLIQTQHYEREPNDDENALSYLKKLRQNDFNLLLSEQLQSIPARVIYRSPNTWTNSLWINVGSADNKTLGRELIAKNSPVVVGTSVAGVIDYVGTHQSRVRMITDSGLTPSVRVMREEGDETWFLAKGELRGSTEAVWRGLSTVLKGVGFNYDYPDEEGPARDLRTGEVVAALEKPHKIPIIQNGDLLITTGMDGVFPRGLRVAKVSRINLLKEGDYYYEIEAIACIKNLDDLSSVFVLPSTGYNADIQAPHIVR